MRFKTWVFKHVSFVEAGGVVIGFAVSIELDEPPPHAETSKVVNKAMRIFITNIINWCGTPVSNRRPSAWQADALPTELVPHWLVNILF